MQEYLCCTATACYFLLLSISVGEHLTLFSYFIFQHEGKEESVVPRKTTFIRTQLELRIFVKMIEQVLN